MGDCGIRDSKKLTFILRKMTSKRRKVLPAGGEAVFVNMKFLYLALNNNRFVVGKRTKLWYILSGTELYRNIIALAVQEKRI